MYRTEAERTDLLRLGSLAKHLRAQLVADARFQSYKTPHTGKRARDRDGTKEEKEQEGGERGRMPFPASTPTSPPSNLLSPPVFFPHSLLFTAVVVFYGSVFIRGAIARTPHRKSGPPPSFFVSFVRPLVRLLFQELGDIRFYGQRLCRRSIPLDRDTFLVDEELGEVPLDTLQPKASRNLLFQPLPEGMRLGSIDIDLIE